MDFSKLIQDDTTEAWVNSENEVIYHDAGSLTFDPNIDRNFNHTNWKQLK